MNEICKCCGKLGIVHNPMYGLLGTWHYFICQDCGYEFKRHYVTLAEEEIPKPLKNT